MLFFRSAFVILATALATLVSANGNHIITSVPCNGGTAHKVQCGLTNFFPSISASVAAEFAIDTTYYGLNSVQVSRLNNCNLAVGGGAALAGNLQINAGSVFALGGEIIVGVESLVGGLFGLGGHTNPTCSNTCKCNFALNYSQLLFPTIDVAQAAKGNCADKATYQKWKTCYHKLVTACGGKISN